MSAGIHVPDESSGDRHPIETLADAYLARLRRGERPMIEEYCQAHPEMADQIRTLFPTLAMMEDLGDDSSAEVTGAFGSGVPAAEQPDWADRLPKQIGDYRILREVGRGGMGVVYEAEQQSLNRRVALKVLAASKLIDATHVERFKREARSAARLHHTNIVPVFGVGYDDGRHYYVMQFIRGQGLDQVIEELRRMKLTSTPTGVFGGSKASQFGSILSAVASGAARAVSANPRDQKDGSEPVQISATVEREIRFASKVAQSLVTGAFSRQELELIDPEGMAGEGEASPPQAGAVVRIDSSADATSGSGNREYWRSVARIGIQVADALAYANTQGILHRDIKPGNLLLDLDGAVWVTDFGLAKALEGENITHTGDILGTLRYMAPERFRGQCDARADVYSLGLTLWEMAALRPAFESRDRQALIKSLMHDEIPPVRRANPAAPRDLDTIIQKATAREPADRYQTAAALADDLRRFFDDKPISARRIGYAERLSRWSRRNPLIASLTAAACVLFVAAFIVVTALWRQADSLRRDADKFSADAADHLDEAERQKQIAIDQEQAAARQHERAKANYARARGAVDKLMTGISEGQALREPGLEDLRADLLEAAQQFYQGFLDRGADDKDMKVAVAAAWLRLGTILQENRQSAPSAAALAEAKSRYEALLKDEPDHPDYMHGFAQCLSIQSSEARAIWEKLTERYPDDTRFATELGNLYNALALSATGAERLALHEKALALQERVALARPDDPEALAGLAATVNNIGVVLSQQNRLDEALSMYQRAMARKRALLALAPYNAMWSYWMTVGSSNVATTEQRLGRTAAALASAQSYVDSCRKLVEISPKFAAAVERLTIAYGTLASIQKGNVPAGETVETLRRGIELIERQPELSFGALYNLACLRANLADAVAKDESLSPERRSEEVKRFADAALETLLRAIDAGTTDADHMNADTDLVSLRSRADFRALVALARKLAAAVSLKDAAAKLKACQEALALRQDARRIMTSSRAAEPSLARYYLRIAEPLIELGRFQEAEQFADRALFLLSRSENGNANEYEQSALLARLQLSLGTAAWNQGRYSEAAAAWQQALDGLEALAEVNSIAIKSETIKARTDICDAYAAAGIWDRAAEQLEAIVELEDSLTFSASYYRLLPMLLLAGDAEARRRHSAQLYRRFADAATPETLDRVAKSWLLEPLTGEDLARATAMASKAFERGQNSANRRFFLFCKALAHYRNHQLDEAARDLNELEGGATGDPMYLRVGSRFVHAMTQSRLGDSAKAQELLLPALGEFGQSFIAPNGTLKRSQTDELITEALRREAVATVAADYPIDFGSSDFTLAAWIKTSSSNCQIISKNSAEGPKTPGGRTLFLQDGALGYDVIGVREILCSTPINDNQWHHVAATHRVRGGLVTLYVDAVEAMSWQLPANDDPRHVLRIGAGDLDRPPFVGGLDDVIVLPRALGERELSALKEGASFAPTTARWEFEEGQGSMASNVAGRAFAATLSEVSWGEGRRGKGLIFDGNGVVHIAPSAANSHQDDGARNRRLATLLHRARILALLGDAENADAAAAEATKGMEARADAFAARATIYHEVGQFERARGDIEKAIGLLREGEGSPLTRARLHVQAGDRNRAVEEFNQVAQSQGPKWFQTGWWVVGGYPHGLSGRQPPEISPDPFQPLATGARRSTSRSIWWKPCGSNPTEVVSLAAEIGAFSQTSAYALCYFYAAEPTTVAMKFGGDNQGRFWLNGKFLHQFLIDTWNKPQNEASVRAPLEAGWNTLLARISNDDGDWRLTVKVSDSPEAVSNAQEPNSNADPDVDAVSTLIDANPASAELLRNRGTFLAGRGEWQRAAGDFARALALDASSSDAWLKMGALRLQLDQPGGYDEVCRVLQRDFVGDGAAELDVAWACLIAGDIDYDRTVIKAILAKPPVGDDTTAGKLDRALRPIAAYRDGRFDDAIRMLEATAPPASHVEDRCFAAINRLFAAMSYHRLAKSSEAARALAAADAILTDEAPAAASGLLESAWHWRLYADAVRREAASVILSESAAVGEAAAKKKRRRFDDELDANEKTERPREAKSPAKKRRPSLDDAFGDDKAGTDDATTERRGLSKPAEKKSAENN